MSKKKRTSNVLHTSQAQPAQEPAVAASAKRDLFSRMPWTYIIVFLALWFFCAVVYGDVFARTGQENFVINDASAMAFLTSAPGGYLFLVGRWMLCLMAAPWLGCFVLALILTLLAYAGDRLFFVSRRWRGVMTVLPVAFLVWTVLRGTNLYYKSEPSLLFLIPVLALIATTLLALLARLLVRKGVLRLSSKKEAKQPAGRKEHIGCVVAVVLVALLSGTTNYFNQNEILTARMQMRMLRGDWDGMVDDGLSARRPTRAVAAYFAIALVQSHQLLEHIFDIPFDYPDPHLEKHEGNEEYGVFLADANFYAGLINTGYRCAIDYQVMNGPRLYTLKRLALCALMNGEKELANRYFTLIEKMPFQSSFVDHYRPMLNDEDLLAESAELQCVRTLIPDVKAWEQNFRSPTFLGYNAALLSGSDNTLETAIATRLYSKELDAALPLVRIYVQKKNGQVPLYVQQVMALMANKFPECQAEFAKTAEMQQNTLMAFIAAVKPIIDERMEASKGKTEEQKGEIRDQYNKIMRETIGNDWVGTYYYYYYCENNDRNQVEPAKKAEVN